ncbi:MAG: nucleotidyltransferase family protein [Syntrophaceae bacterium]|nr:nucleotidyltransferase family protein [Syntrophaceae bacterium]
MVLAAGLGTRLRPLTEDIPKCLIPLAGRPLMDWTLSWLHEAGVRECIINLHYLGDKVRNFVADGSQYGLRVQYSYEPELLGTAGAVKKVASFFNHPFFVIYSDNFSRWNLKKLVKVHEKNQALATMAVHWREDVSQSGVVELDQNGRILCLMEKPKPEQNLNSHYVNAGFYFLDSKVLDYIPEGRFCDFAFDIFPKMVQAGEKIYAVKMEDPIIGIDTIEAYREANELATRLVHSTGS